MDGKYRALNQIVRAMLEKTIDEVDECVSEKEMKEIARLIATFLAGKDNVFIPLFKENWHFYLRRFSATQRMGIGLFGSEKAGYPQIVDCVPSEDASFKREGNNQRWNADALYKLFECILKAL